MSPSGSNPGSTRASEHLYLFLHIPKSAGSTLVHHLEAHLPSPQSITLDMKVETKDAVWAHVKANVSRPEQLGSIQGHRVFHGLHSISARPARYYTFLRDPVERVLSLYNFWADSASRRRVMFRNGRLVPFAEFVESDAAQNNTLRFLYYAIEGDLTPGCRIDPTPSTIATAKRFLDQCWFIGFVDEFDRDIAHVASAMGLPAAAPVRNVSRRHVDLREDDPLRARILELNSVDLELYEYAADLRGHP